MNYQLDKTAQYATIIGTIIAFLACVISFLAWIYPIEKQQVKAEATKLPQASGQGTAVVSDEPNALYSPLQIIEDYLNTLPPSTWPYLLGALGTTLLILDVYVAYSVYSGNVLSLYSLGKGLSGIAAILGGIIGYWMWGGWGILSGLFIGYLLPGLLLLFSVTPVAGALFGAFLGFFLGIASAFIYLAIPGPFEKGLIIFFGIIGVIVGLAAGIIFRPHLFGKEKTANLRELLENNYNKD